MENKQKIPQVRFKGFTDAWEQRRFGELGSVAMCKRVFKEQTLDTGEIPFYKIGTFGGEPDAFISRELFEEYKCKFSYPENGDMLISASGTIGRTVEYTGKDEYFQDSNIVWFKHNDRIDNSFLKCLYSIVKWSGIEGSTIKRLYNDNFLKTEFMLPCVEEQQQIGNYFRNLDNLITLHQRKCDTLQKLKKSMLQKMFPKNDSLYPEIRFEGFTDAWEQRELKELASFAKGSGYSKNDIKEQGTPLILYGRLYTKYETKIYEVDTFAEPQKGSIYSKGCEVIVPASGETSEDIARASYVAKSGILLGGDLNIIYPNDTIEPTFLALSISNGEQQKNLAKKAQGKSVVHLHNSDLETVNIVYPTRTEQARIGQYFDHLDTLITLHQRKLETLKKLKKSMLQKMFI